MSSNYLNNYSVKQLKDMLADHGDNERFHFGLVFKKPTNYEQNLEKMLYEAYNLLLYSEDAVKYLSDTEKKTGTKMIYFDDNGCSSNKGAIGLYEKINKFTASYSERMMRMQIEN